MDQSPPTSEPRLCKMGCGFFGSGATEDCCSKCFLEMQKQKGHCLPVASSPPKTTATAMEELPIEPMQVEPAPAAPTATTPKKKKKTSYKAMMAAMTKPSEKDIEKEKEAIRKATGGGTFSKIEKI